ncbi:DUF2493 domain-containing protein [Candidatus Dependentiae bacterium]|nr:MAG: DUF2493 domain-containing protein [Candidatus Dependentiae bacterium]
MNLIIAGGRDFDDYYLLCQSLDHLLKNTDRSMITVFSGQAKGADYLGERWAKAQSPRIPIRWFPANWDKHGKKAGILRNQEMLDAGATHLIAFWDGKSRGTNDMITRAKRAGIQVRVINYELKKTTKPKFYRGISNIKKEEN